MKLIKRVASICLLMFCVLGTNNLVKAGGDVDKIEGFGPYSKYLRGDEFSTFIFTDVPDDLVPQVREWMKTNKKDEGYCKESDGRNSFSHSSLTLADKSYAIIGKRYNIPINLIPYFIINNGLRKNECYFDSLMPDNLKPQARSILPRIRADFHAEEQKIVKWMLACRKAHKIVPIEPTTCTIL